MSGLNSNLSRRRGGMDHRGRDDLETDPRPAGRPDRTQAQAAGQTPEARWLVIFRVVLGALALDIAAPAASAQHVSPAELARARERAVTALRAVRTPGRRSRAFVA